MLRANSSAAKYLAALCGALTVGLLGGVLPTAPRISILFLIGTAIAYTATFYFLARERTTEVVEVSPWRNAIGFVVAGVAVVAWMYATLELGVDVTEPGDAPRALLALTITGLALGLADVGWTTGKLAESLAIRRARDDVAG